MITVRGRTSADITRAHLVALVASRPVTLDLGAGDGAFAYRLAQAHPDRFVIAMDPVRENLREYSARAAKKAERGGLANVLYAVASIGANPGGAGRDRGRNLRDTAVGVADAGDHPRGRCGGSWDRVVRARRGGVADRAEHADLRRSGADRRAGPAGGVPPSTCSSAGAGVRAHGIAIAHTRWMDADEVATLGTTWAKRLSHRHPPRSVLIEATVRHRQGAGTPSAA